jgi:hypothetical protein
MRVESPSNRNAAPVIPRVFAALPDALTSAVFLVGWIAPDVVGAPRLKNLMLTMLIEFIVMHSSAFYAVILGMDDLSRLKRSLFLIGLSAFYLMFVLGFSLGFDSTWPIWAFGWLFLSRFWHLWVTPTQDGADGSRLMTSWLVSAMAYLAGAFLTILLPLPRLGITPEVIAAMQLSPKTSGLWVEQPWVVLAFGGFYFGVLAWSKYRAFALPALQRQ